MRIFWTDVVAVVVNGGSKVIRCFLHERKKYKALEKALRCSSMEANMYKFSEDAVS